MIAAVYMYDRPTFDGLWGYAKAHFNRRRPDELADQLVGFDRST